MTVRDLKDMLTQISENRVITNVSIEAIGGGRFADIRCYNIDWGLRTSDGDSVEMIVKGELK